MGMFKDNIVNAFFVQTKKKGKSLNSELRDFPVPTSISLPK
jgi:hypothetical protein